MKIEQDQKVKALRPEDRWEIARMQSPLLEGDEELEPEGDLVVEEGLEETKMPRPRKTRRVMGRPNSSYFKPAGVRMMDLLEVALAMPEFEAIRLIDFEGLSQVEAGTKMHISQSTLSRILTSGRKKIADALITGKAIKIEK